MMHQDQKEWRDAELKKFTRYAIARTSLDLTREKGEFLRVFVSEETEQAWLAWKERATECLIRPG